MTVICYKDGVLAADRSSCDESDMIVGVRTKIVRASPKIMGGTCGSAHHATLFREWVENGMVVGSIPDLGDDKFGALLILDGEAFRYNHRFVPVKVEAPFHTIGNGEMVAAGAMFMGATAEQAVAAACALVLGCGGGVDVLRLAVTHEASPAASQVI